MTATNQIQLKLSLSHRLNDLLRSKAGRFGVPVTQYVKHIIITDVEEEKYPTFVASEEIEKKTEKALKEIDKAIPVENIDKFFDEL